MLENKGIVFNTNSWEVVGQWELPFKFESGVNDKLKMCYFTINDIVFDFMCEEHVKKLGIRGTDTESECSALNAGVLCSLFEWKSLFILVSFYDIYESGFYGGLRINDEHYEIVVDLETAECILDGKRHRLMRIGEFSKKLVCNKYVFWNRLKFDDSSRFSNFYERSMEFNGMVFSSAEAAYYSMKTEDLDLRSKLSGVSAEEAHKIGVSLKKRSWKRDRESVMWGVINAKMSQNADILAELLRTRERNLVYDSEVGNMDADDGALLGSLLTKYRISLIGM